MSSMGPIWGEGPPLVFKSILDAMPDAVDVVTAKLRVVYSNPAAEALLQRSGLSGSPLACALSHGGAGMCLAPGAHACILRDVVSSGRPRLECAYLGTSDLDEGPALEISVSPLRRDDGSVWGVLETARDLSGRHRVERSIVRGKGEWEATVDILEDIVVLTDSEGRIRRCNAALCRNRSLPFAELLGRRAGEVFTEAGLPGLDELSEGTIEHRSKGSHFHVTKRRLSVPFLPSGLVYVIRDTTAEVEARRRLAREQEHLSATLSAISDGVIAVDKDGRISLMNSAAERLISVSREAALGLPLAQVYRTQVSARCSGVIRAPARMSPAALEHESSLRQRLLHTRTNSTLLISESISRITDGGSDAGGEVIVFRDIGDVRRLESIAANVELTNNLGQVLSSVRHEIGNPLNALKTALSFYRERYEVFPREKALKYLDRCLEDVGRIEHLLDRLRSMNLFQGAEPHDTDVGLVLRHLSSRLEDDLPSRGIRCEARIPVGAIMAWADPRALEQVLLGVVTNAMEAVSGVEGPLVTIEVREEPGTVVIRVLDNGPGVRLEDLPHVFLPLFTTKPRGTGLGLPIARTMLSKMEGTIELANRRDGGASVEITLSAGMREPRLTLP